MNTLYALLILLLAIGFILEVGKGNTRLRSLLAMSLGFLAALWLLRLGVI